MMAFADEYVDVAERVRQFVERYPGGSLQSEIVEMSETRVVIRAYAYRDSDDTRPGIGHSQLAIPGRTNFTRGSEIENAETSAWGRALAALGFATKYIATRDEVEMKQGPSKPRIEAHLAAMPDSRTCSVHDGVALTLSKRTQRWGHVLADGTACVEEE